MDTRRYTFFWMEKYSILSKTETHPANLFDFYGFNKKVASIGVASMAGGSNTAWHKVLYF